MQVGDEIILPRILRIFVTPISDDNFSILQRRILLQFARIKP
jgi:hypothetical protein